jgi:HD-GYP domain-containing protein (c-di-GMP phosphodiesterase class II)
VMAEPQNLALVKEIALVTEMDEVFPYVGTRSAILAAIKKHYYGDPTAFDALERGGVAALKSEVSSISRAFESTSDSRVGPVTGTGASSVDGELRRGTSVSSRGSSSQINATQLREALGAVRGTVGESDYLETLNILVGLLEMPRKDFRGHSAQVARQSALIARRMGLQPREVMHTNLAAYLHDLGKKPDKHFTLPSIAKSDTFKQDARRSLRAPIKLFETVHLPSGVNAVLAHLYEAYDGTGLPQGVKGDDIPSGARIIAAVDAFLDLTRSAQNPFARVLTKPEAIAQMRDEAGKLFDPLVVETLAILQSGDLLRQRLENDGRQVVIADPDEATRTDLLDALSQQGLVAQTVVKLEGVVDAVLAGDADVIGVALAYGVGDLVALLQFVRTRPETASVPIVVLGEPTDPGSRDRIAQAGLSAFVSSSANPDETGAQIRGLLFDRVEHGGPGHLVKGSFDEMRPVDLLRTLGRARKWGRLNVRNGPQEGYLQMEKGRAVFATYAGKQGDEALAFMFATHQAEFSYDPDGLLNEMPHLDQDLEVIARAIEAINASV